MYECHIKYESGVYKSNLDKYVHVNNTQTEKRAANPVCVCVCVCVCACVCVCMCMCVCACVLVWNARPTTLEPNEKWIESIQMWYTCEFTTRIIYTIYTCIYRSTRGQPKIEWPHRAPHRIWKKNMKKYYTLVFTTCVISNTYTYVYRSTRGQPNWVPSIARLMWCSLCGIGMNSASLKRR